MEDYNKLVEKNQTGEIDDLEFLLAQEDLAALYVADMQAEGDRLLFSFLFCLKSKWIFLIYHKYSLFSAKIKD